MSVWNIGLSKPLLRFLRRPSNMQAIADIYQCYSKDLPTQNVVQKKVLSDERFKNLYDNWYVHKESPLEELLKLPKGTFGHIYARHMKQNQIEPYANPYSEKNILTYLWFRAGHVHDICHIILGFDTSYEGELAIKGFELAQCHSASTAAILSGGLLGVSARHPELSPKIMDMIIEGYNLGKAFPLLIGIKWDEEWKTPIKELYEKYHFPKNHRQYDILTQETF